MGRHDVHRLSEGDLVVDVQSDLVNGLGSRAVLPLLARADVPASIVRLHPEVMFDDTSYVVATHLISAVPSHVMGPILGSLAAHSDALTRALDTLITDW
ncbi:MAG: CcdB family protein [Pseudomonadota bacterium]